MKSLLQTQEKPCASSSKTISYLKRKSKCILVNERGCEKKKEDSEDILVLVKGEDQPERECHKKYFGLEDKVDIYMGTFSKSLASLGGYMAAKKEVIEYVRNTSRPFIFSASITPASVACARASLKILREHPERVKALKEVSEYMRNGLKAKGIKIIEAETPIIPIFTYTNERTFLACKMLQEKGVYVNPCVSPAVPVGQSILRTSYTATHTHEQLDRAINAIAEVMVELDKICPIENN